MKHFDLKNKLPSFWTIQIIGWVIYFAVIYITFLSIAQPENFLNLLYLKGFRALTGFFLTSFFLRPVYRRFGNQLSIFGLISLVFFGAVVLGSAWTVIEAVYNFLASATFNTTNYLARSPRISLDYAMTLTAWSASYLGVKNWLAWQDEREKALHSSALAQKAQLEMLRYQLNPHFLFNALNSIRASIDEDKKRAKQMITEFSEFLRFSLLKKGDNPIPLGEELEAIVSYLEIEKIRFDEKLQLEIDVSREAENFSIPPFLIHPLIENAVKHGKMNDDQPLRISLSAKVTNHEKLIVEIINSGEFADQSANNGTKIGLKNVRERLEKIFADQADFKIWTENECVHAKIEITK